MDIASQNHSNISSSIVTPDIMDYLMKNPDKKLFENPNKIINNYKSFDSDKKLFNKSDYINGYKTLDSQFFNKSDCITNYLQKKPVQHFEYKAPSISEYGSFMLTVAGKLTNQQVLNIARLLDMSPARMEECLGKVHPARGVFEFMENCCYINSDNVTELAVLLANPVIGASDVAESVMKFQQDYGSNRQVKEIPAQPYIEMKLELSQALTREQREAMYPIVQIPGGRRDSIKDAYDVFTWMERGLKITKDNLSELKNLLNNPSVAAANLVQIVEKYEYKKNGGQPPRVPAQNPVSVQAPSPNVNPVPSVVQDPAPEPVKMDVSEENKPSSDKDELTKCKVCFERDVDIAINPCGHVYCQKCLPSFKACPHCRGPIQGHMKVYLFN